MSDLDFSASGSDYSEEEGVMESMESDEFVTRNSRMDNELGGSKDDLDAFETSYGDEEFEISVGSADLHTLTPPPQALWRRDTTALNGNCIHFSIFTPTSVLGARLSPTDRLIPLFCPRQQLLPIEIGSQWLKEAEAANSWQGIPRDTPPLPQ